ncbi:proliferating cell nuclear antigen (pcna) [Candidatus Woesearchaeota archaeon]|nr:proliferating cell nuclear antigen (pcna) [Candidatus Woesearchaeota archaeon]
MRLVLNDPTYLKDSITVISDLVNEAKFSVTDEGLELVAMDPANVAMVIFKLLASNFSEFKVGDKKELCLNLANLKQVLKRAKANDQLVLEAGGDNKLKVQLKSGATRTFHLPLLDLGEGEQRVPNLSFPIVVSTRSDVLNEAIEDSSIISESVTLSVEPERFTVSAAGDTSNAHISIPADDITKIKSETKADVKSRFSLEYLKKMMNASKLSSEVHIYLNQDYPLKIEYKVMDKLLLSFILAPRVEND